MEKTNFTMRIVATILLFTIFLLFDATNLDAQDSVNQKSKRTIIHENLKIGTFPTRVIHGKSFFLSNLKIKRGDSGISGSLNYLRQPKDNDEFLLIVYLSMKKYLLFTYYTNNVRQVFVTPRGSSGDVALTAKGYKIKSAGNKGTMEFYIPYKTYGVYNITGIKGNIFVFCLDGDTKKQIEKDSFLAISNVIASDY